MIPRSPVATVLALAALAIPAGADESAPVQLTLDEAVRQALASNYTIQVESLSVPIAGAGVLAAYGRYDPQIAFRYTDGTNEQPERRQSDTGQPLPPTVFKFQSYDGSVAGELPLGLGYRVSLSSENARASYTEPVPFIDDFTSFAGISGQIPLLRNLGGASTVTAIRIAKTDRSISEWEFRATLINTVTRVSYAYSEVLFARQNLAIARRLSENTAALHRENQERYRVGSMSDYDVLSAQARVATRAEGVLLAERNVRDAENQLKQLISGDTTAAILSRPLDLPPPAAPKEVVVDAGTDLARALDQRPDYQQARLAVHRNDLDYRLYRNQLLPSVDVFGSYGYNGVGDAFGKSRTMIRDREHPSYAGGVSVSLPVFSAAERARARTARLARQRAELSLRQLEQDIVINVGNAADDITTTWKRVIATRTSRELSERTLNAELRRLRAGTGSTFLVLQQQELLSGDEIREARALADYRNALAEYDRQLGRTLEAFHVDVKAAADAAS